VAARKLSAFEIWKKALSAALEPFKDELIRRAEMVNGFTINIGNGILRMRFERHSKEKK